MDFYSRTTLAVDPELVDLTKKHEIPVSLGHGITKGNINAMYKDCSKYNKEWSFTADEPTFLRAISMAVEDFSFLKGVGFMFPDDAITRSSNTKSPGGIWTRRYTTKQAVIEDNRDWLNTFLWDRLELKPCPKPIIPCVWKEEVKELEKIHEDKIRTMDPVPVEYIAAFNMVFGPAMDIISSRDCTKTHIWPGSSPWYGGYHHFMENMKRFRYFFAFDVEKFDSRVKTKIKVLIFWNFWAPMFASRYEIEVAWNVYSSLFDAFIVMADGNILYFDLGGRWSGDALTAIENSIISLILFYYALLTQNFTPKEIKECFAYVFMGDDNDFSTDEKRFNAEKYRLAFAACGFNFKDFKPEPVPYYEAWFCGMKCRKEPFNGYWVFEVEYDRLFYSLMICKKSATPADKMQKLVAIYQHTYFSPDSKKVFNMCLDFYNKHSTDYLVADVFFGTDPASIERMFLPHLQGLQLNGPADKICNSILSTLYPMRYHGKYCGPYHNKGLAQESQHPDFDDPEPDSYLDEGCQEHDNTYATPGADLYEADQKLAHRAWEYGDPFVFGVMKIQSTLRNLGVLDRYNPEAILSDPSLLDDLIQEMPKNNQKVQRQVRRLKKEVRSVKKKTKQMRKPRGIAKAPRRYRRPSGRRPRSTGFSTNVFSEKNLVGSSNRKPLPVQRYALPVFTAETTDVEGSIYVTQKVNPYSFSNTLSFRTAKSYEKYRVKRHRLCMQSNTLATTGGQFMAFFDVDVSDSYKVGDVVDFSSFSNSTSRSYIAPYWQEKEWCTPWIGGSGDKYTSIPPSGFDLNLRYNGQWVICNSMSPGTNGQLARFFLEVEYEFHEFLPEDDGDFATFNCSPETNLITEITQGAVGTSDCVWPVTGTQGIYKGQSLAQGLLNFANEDREAGITMVPDGLEIVMQFDQPGDYFLAATSTYVGTGFSVTIDHILTVSGCEAFGSFDPSGQLDPVREEDGTTFLSTSYNGWFRKTSNSSVTATIIFRPSDTAFTTLSAAAIGVILWRVPVRQSAHNFGRKPKSTKTLSKPIKEGKEEIEEILIPQSKSTKPVQSKQRGLDLTPSVDYNPVVANVLRKAKICAALKEYKDLFKSMGIWDKVQEDTYLDQPDPVTILMKHAGLCTSDAETIISNYYSASSASEDEED